MQVTTLGSTSPAGPGMLPFAFGGTGADVGFAQALGAVLQGGAAAATPGTPILNPANALAAQPAKDVAALPAVSAPLAPFQGTTNLSQLMATASPLPVVAEGAAVATPLPAQPTEIAQPGTEIAQPALETEIVAQPQLGKPAKPATDSGTAPELVEAVPADTAEPAAPKPDTAVRAEPAKIETATPSTAPRKPVRSAKDETTEPPAADAVVQLPQAMVPVAAQQVRHAAPSVKSDADPQTVIGGKRAAITSDAAQVNTPAANDTNAVASIADGNGNAANAGQSDDQGTQRDPQASFAAKIDALAQPAAGQGTSHAAKAEAAPAAAEPVIAARPNHVGQALGVEIARKVEAGEETLRVRLSPEHLGKVEITLAFDDGKLQATVRTESAHALDLLRQDAPDLARTLDQAGIRTDAQSFRFEARADTGGQSSPQQQQSQRGNQPQHQAAADDLEPAPAYRAIRADGQVDLIA